MAIGLGVGQVARCVQRRGCSKAPPARGSWCAIGQRRVGGAGAGGSRWAGFVRTAAVTNNGSVRNGRGLRSRTRSLNCRLGACIRVNMLDGHLGY